MNLSEELDISNMMTDSCCPQDKGFGFFDLIRIAVVVVVVVLNILDLI